MTNDILPDTEETMPQSKTIYIADNCWLEKDERGEWQVKSVGFVDQQLIEFAKALAAPVPF